MDAPRDDPDDDLTHRVSNLLLQKQWLLCAVYALDQDGDTPATRDDILRHQATYSQPTLALPLENELLHEYIDHLVSLNLLTEHQTEDAPTYDLAISPETLRAGLQNSPRFQILKQMTESNLL